MQVEPSAPAGHRIPPAEVPLRHLVRGNGEPAPPLAVSDRRHDPANADVPFEVDNAIRREREDRPVAIVDADGRRRSRLVAHVHHRCVRVGAEHTEPLRLRLSQIDRLSVLIAPVVVGPRLPLEVVADDLDPGAGGIAVQDDLRPRRRVIPIRLVPPVRRPRRRHACRRIPFVADGIVRPHRARPVQPQLFEVVVVLNVIEVANVDAPVVRPPPAELARVVVDPIGILHPEARVSRQAQIPIRILVRMDGVDLRRAHARHRKRPRDDLARHGDHLGQGGENGAAVRDDTALPPSREAIGVVEPLFLGRRGEQVRRAAHPVDGETEAVRRG